MRRFESVGSDFIEKEVHDGPKSFCHDPLVPPGFTDAITDLHLPYPVVVAHDADASDGDILIPKGDRPEIGLILLIAVDPIIDHKLRDRYVGMRWPGKESGHFVIAGPIIEHGLRILPAEAA